MKFKGKPNIRIACKEFFTDRKKIVMICLINKKSQANTKKITRIYESIGSYEYEFNR
jgi:hypothetical protein